MVGQREILVAGKDNFNYKTYDVGHSTYYTVDRLLEANGFPTYE
jgi:hypothetical protein